MAQTPGPQQTPATQPATTAPTSYTYTAYHPPGTYAQVSTSYPSPYPSTASYQTGVTGYGAWPYQYSYLPQQHAQSSVQQARPNTVLPPTTSTYTSTFAPTAPPKTTSFSSYTPAPQVRETATAAATPATTGRVRHKQQANFKGLFTKEREYAVPDVFLILSHANDPAVKSLMYGFGDDRNPATDTVNVMEEILIEYITDVVRKPLFCRR